MSQSTAAAAESMRLRVEARDWGRFHTTTWWACGFGWMSDSMNIASLSVALPLIAIEFKLSRFESGSLASATFIGFLIGSVITGLLADRLGRRTLLVTNIIIFSIASVIAGFSPNFAFLLIIRGIQGLGLGAEFPIISIYLNEVTAKRHLNRIVALTTAFYAYGFAIIPLLGIVLVPLMGWRGLFFVLVLPVIVALWVRVKLPESPEFLARRGKSQEAERAMSLIEAKTPQRSGASGQRHGDTRLHVEGAGLTLNLLIPMICIWILIFIAQYGFTTWVPTVITTRVKGIGSISYLLTGILFTGMIVGYLVSGYLGSHLSVRTFFYLAFLEFGVALIVFGFVPNIVVTLIFGWFAGAGFGLTTVSSYAYTPIQFNVAVRGTGVGLSTGIGRIGAIVGPPLAGILTPTGSFALSFAMFGVASFLTLAFIAWAESARRHATGELSDQSVSA